MQLVFKRPAKLGEKLYVKSPMPQEVPDELMEHWFTKAMMKDGHIEKWGDEKVVAQAPVVVTPKVEIATPAKAQEVIQPKAKTKKGK